MNFKKVELNGFKSFADKTEIKFDNGVTCIVGPNGCGKSNVADSIRWVFGEQSAKTMRGSNMQDVIFGGTQTRKSQSFCEVTLTFDNSTHMFADLDYDEVAFTRRLFRSGESEYLINKQPCRMKDIVDRLHAVGLGKEGYSIIGQGKIEQIMNAKPEDRRAIFEEATGIIVFKSRKQEIERRLANSYTNLNIFLQRMGEVEHMLTPLARQAEKTKKYKELYEQLKHNEINLYIYKHDNAESARASIGSVLTRIQAEIDASRREAEGMDEKYAENRRRIAQSDELLQKLNEKILEYTVEMQKKEGDVNVIRARITFFEQQKEGEEKAVEEGGARLEAIGEELAAAQNSADDYEKKIIDAQRESETLSGEIAALSEKLSEYEALSDESQKSIVDTIENLSEIRQNIGTLSAKKEAVEERIAEIAAAAESLKGEIGGRVRLPRKGDESGKGAGNPRFEHRGGCGERVAVQLQRPHRGAQRPRALLPQRQGRFRGLQILRQKTDERRPPQRRFVRPHQGRHRRHRQNGRKVRGRHRNGVRRRHAEHRHGDQRRRALSD